MSWLPTNGFSFGTAQTPALIALIIALVLSVLLVAGIRRGRSRRGHARRAPDLAGQPGMHLEEPSSGVDAEAMHSTISEAALTDELRRRLAGLPADGSTARAETLPDRVVWVEDGDEVLVHLDSLHVQLLERILVASLDLESDQTGRQTLVVPLALASGTGPGGLLAVTEELPRGDDALVARWGHTLQEALWAGLLEFAGTHAETRGHALTAISAVPGGLHLHSAVPLAATDTVPV